MKVLILSMQRIINYGSFLQAYALKSLIEELGHSVSFLDIKKGEYIEDNFIQSNCNNNFNNFNKLRLKEFIFRIKNKINTLLIVKSQLRYLNLSKELNYDTDGYDATVIGSDEVFNCCPNCSWGISSQLFGNVNTKIVFSYAGSCGYTISKDVPLDCVKLLSKYVLNMKAVSVRDENTHNLFLELFGVNSTYNLDPVLIYDFKKEIETNPFKCKKKYMIVYAYHERINDLDEVNAIKKYANDNKLKIYCIGGMLSWCDRFLNLTPFQVLSAFKNANCIVTDTFHGTIMSAKFKKKFATIIRDNNKNKLLDLLKRLNLESQIFAKGKNLDSILNNDINYDNFEKMIDFEKNKTRIFLSDNLKD